ncbi:MULTISPECIES: acyl carrier protein [unclassified Streptomyces]|uniref:acyl carrier protein n=1 Tax=unclassified Streptomyces TaxID=2593676 RepID=UPI002DDA1709|nr:acyl carrier protein [Streptomyces sp. NBC_01257]WRZ63441.1 acyl carrier protein [Streptomyces sp. NBC_01257]WSU57405.1 acyl carrier protein [Streptomyces sp. NBC_01104]
MNSHDIPLGEESVDERAAEAIRGFLISRIAGMTRLPEEKVDADTPISAYGLDSVHTLELVVEIEDWLGISVPDDLPWKHPTIRAIADELTSAGVPGDALTGIGEADGPSAA